MTDEYDEITAYHYRAYRPALHYEILNRCLGKEKFTRGLDVGSGTGHSSLALARFCNQVIAIEPSPAMRKMALVHPKVEYQNYPKNRFDFNDATFDIITLAGSLVYAKSQHLLNELMRIGTSATIIVIYDFELDLEEVLDELKIKISESSFYNHQEDFTGLENHKLAKSESGVDKMEVTMTVSDLAHIILSVKTFYLPLVESHGAKNLFGKLVKLLKKISHNGIFDIKAKTYHTLYRVVK